MAEKNEITKEWKVLTLVDARSTGDNDGSPVYHARLVKAEAADAELLKDFKAELDCFGVTEDDGNGYVIEVDGIECTWGNKIAGMTLEEVKTRLGWLPKCYSIDIDCDGKVYHSVTDLT